MIAKSKFMYAVVMTLLLLAAVPLASQQAWAADGLSAGDTPDLQEQASSKDYEFENGAIKVYGVKSGKVSYSKKAKTLTLRSASFSSIYLYNCEKLTVKLVGKNKASDYFIYGSDSNATITGAGSVAGPISGIKKLTIESGTVKAVAKSNDSSSVYGVICTTLNVMGGSLTATAKSDYYAYGASCTTLNMRGGNLTASATAKNYDAYGISCTKLAINGGSLTASAPSKSYDAYGISCTKLAINGGSLTASAKSNGYRTYGISCSEDINVNGGTINVTKNSGKHGGTAIRGKKITVDGGKVLLKECDGEGIYCEGLTIKKGSVLIDDQFSDDSNDQSLNIYGGNLVMTGGMLKVTRSYQTTIYVDSYTTGGEKYRGRTTPTIVHGGKIQITGGKFVAQVRKPRATDAIEADSIASKVSLKDVRGWIDAKGAVFKYDGNVYRTNYVNDSWNGRRYVKEGYADLVKYNGKSAHVTFGKVKLNSLSYTVKNMQPGALETKAGAKVKSVTFPMSVSAGNIEANTFKGAKSLRKVSFESWVDTVEPKAFSGAPKLREVSFGRSVNKISSNAFKGAKALKKIHLGYQSNIAIAANAFAGTTGLTTLEFRSSYSSPFSVTYSKSGKFKSVEWYSGVDISRKAFAKCGKSGGKGLTVTFGSDSRSGIQKSEVNAYRNLFLKYGMPKGFKLQVRSEQY